MQPGSILKSAYREKLSYLRLYPYSKQNHKQQSARLSAEIRNDKCRRRR